VVDKNEKYVIVILSKEHNMNIAEKIKEFNIPVVGSIQNFDSVYDLLSFTKSIEDEEGFVVAFDDGQRVKVKGEWYLKLHKMVDLMKNERELIRLILDEKIDDVLSMIREEDRQAVEEFEHLLQAHWTGLAQKILDYVVAARAEIDVRIPSSMFDESAVAGAKKKLFAVDFVNADPTNRDITGLLFRMWDLPQTYESAWDIVKRSVIGVLNTNTKMDANRHLIGCRWENIFGKDRLAEE